MHQVITLLKLFKLKEQSCYSLLRSEIFTSSFDREFHSLILLGKKDFE